MHQILGEIAPRRAQQSGRREAFALSLIIPPNEAGSERLGFDQVLFEVPPSAEVELVDVTVGLESELEAGEGQIYPANELEIKTGVDLVVGSPARDGVGARVRGGAAFFECILSGEQYLFRFGRLGRGRGGGVAASGRATGPRARA